MTGSTGGGGTRRGRRPARTVGPPEAGPHENEATAGEAAGVTSVGEDYLQIIHHLARDGAPVIAARLAERLGVKPATVTAMLQRLERDGLVVHGPRKSVQLTPAGHAAAAGIVRRHALAERLLTDLLQMPLHEVHQASHRLEHAITPNVEARLLAVLGNPTTCPHGNPIPGLGTVAPDEVPLDTVPAGETVVVLRITEDAEADYRLIQYLQAHGVGPGARLRVRESTRFNAIVVLEGEQGTVTLGTPAAAKLRVRRL